VRDDVMPAPVSDLHDSAGITQGCRIRTGDDKTIAAYKFEPLRRAPYIYMVRQATPGPGAPRRIPQDPFSARDWASICRGFAQPS